MDAIKSYLETMFANLPQSPDVIRAKSELLQMMEDKYHELKSMGKTENEAVGAVISEFGNLGELAEELGITQQVTGAESAQPISLTSTQVSKFLSEKSESAIGISTGVMLCILAVTPLLILSGLSGLGYLQEKIAGALGVGTLLIVIAIVVYFFIIHGIRSEKYEKLEKTNVILDPRTRNEIARMKEEYQPVFARTIALGVVLIMIGVIFISTIGFLELGNDAYIIFPVVLLLGLIAIAVRGFITAGFRQQAYDMLLNEGDYTPSHKKSNRTMEIVGGPYWLLVTIGYLAWSFITGNWQFTWIVWPIAGVLFAVIAAVLSAVDARKAN